MSRIWTTSTTRFVTHVIVFNVSSTNKSTLNVRRFPLVKTYSCLSFVKFQQLSRDLQLSDYTSTHPPPLPHVPLPSVKFLPSNTVAVDTVLSGSRKVRLSLHPHLRSLSFHEGPRNLRHVLVSRHTSPVSSPVHGQVSPRVIKRVLDPKTNPM